MVEYPIAEAEQMLADRLNTAKDSLKATETRLEYLREQITTMEVNIARIYNWSVMKRRAEKEKEKHR